MCTDSDLVIDIRTANYIPLVLPSKLHVIKKNATSTVVCGCGNKHIQNDESTIKGRFPYVHGSIMFFVNMGCIIITQHDAGMNHLLIIVSLASI